MNKTRYTITSVMAIILVITLFSCESNYRNIQKLNLKDGAPVGVAKNINVKYTDSGRIIANLISPLRNDYTNLEFPYQEFPEGVEVFYWNEQQEVTTVTSDFAIRYDETSIVDLRENVVLYTSDSLTLKAEQLYWDQKNQWVFTDQPYRIIFKDGSYNDGAGFDSSEDFTEFLSRSNVGEQIIDRELTNENSEINNGE
ncbi:LPS export ABC transporter periplasmic protein LptC [Aureitalea sp. L0-47]|uniref:LPS export ABC transporter periplasmic protein LptC n=1 Tax=Aureitalea sp. L0-47 TaxID=2816962 RepID=UPI002238F14C|nr:LPS export ABC transporter periplasmic protein LptC [Aureitalea sp. L0-47]MCW5518691.1 LPS export ABC transporter periplasmic protein LptC [Aureitalea sp. L0-47]